MDGLLMPLKETHRLRWLDNDEICASGDDRCTDVLVVECDCGRSFCSTHGKIHAKEHNLDWDEV